MVGPDGSIHIAEYRSLSQKKLQLISRFLAYTIPCLYFVGFVGGSEPLIVQIIVLITNVTMACLFCTKIRRESHLFSHFVSLHSWRYCSKFLSSDVVGYPQIVSPTRLPCLVCISNPFWSGMQIICWLIHILNWDYSNTFHARIMILVLDTQPFLLIFVTPSPTDFLNANLKRNFCLICSIWFCCPVEFQLTYLCITPIHSVAPC